MALPFQKSHHRGGVEQFRRLLLRAVSVKMKTIWSMEFIGNSYQKTATLQKVMKLLDISKS